MPAREDTWLVLGALLRYRAAQIRPAQSKARRRRAEGSAMKAELHPGYHMIAVAMTEGTEYQPRSTWGKAGDSLNLGTGAKSDPRGMARAQQLLDRGGRVS